MRYNPNLTTASAGILMLQKGDYELKISQPKTFKRQKVENGETKDIYGVQYSLTVENGDDQNVIGKNIPLSLYMHSEAAFGINKRFVMAALGFALDDEESFNEKYADADWGIDPDSGELGDIWTQVAGNRVACTADIVPDKRDRSRQQQQFSWRPI